MKQLFATGCATFAALPLFAGVLTRSFPWCPDIPLEGFQVPVALADGVDGFRYSDASDDGGDLRVFAGETALDYEVEKWNPGGMTVVWVKVPTFSSATVLTLKWGEDSSGDAPSANIWDGALVVNHMVDDGSKDSSSYANVFDTNGDAASVPGPVGTARDFHDKNSRLKILSAPLDSLGSVSNRFTLSFWHRGEGQKQQYLFQIGQGGDEVTFYAQSNDAVTLYRNPATRITGTMPTSGMTLRAGATMDAADWHHYAITYDGATYSEYVDGECVASKAVSFELAKRTSAFACTIGASATPGAPVQGYMDEVRFENVCRSADWIRAAALTQGRLSAEIGSVTVTLPASSLVEPLVDFPAFVRFTVKSPTLVASLADGKASVRGADGGSLDYEIDYAYPSSGEVGMWVKMPSYVGGEALTVTPTNSFWKGVEDNDPASLWGANDFVFHLGPQADRLDSTGSGCALYPYHSTGAQAWKYFSTSADGPTGPNQAMLAGTTTVARALSVSKHGMLYRENCTFTNVFTISWWAREELPRSTAIKYLLYFSQPQSGILQNVSGGKYCYYFWNASGTSTGCTLTVPDEGWHHYALVNDGAVVRGYVDGVQSFAKTTALSLALDFSQSGATRELAVGNSAAGAGVGVGGFPGAIDECRLESVARSADWIRACFENQRAQKDGLDWTDAPAFGAASVSGAASSITFATRLSCRGMANVTFCWGTSDGGDDASAWEHVESLGELTEGVVTKTIPGLASDAVAWGRFFASNGSGATSSETVFGRAAPGARGAEAKISVSYSGEALSDFPLAITFTAASGLPADKRTFRIVDEDGASLAWEAESWNPAGTSVVWVRVPRLDGDLTLIAKWSKRLTTDDVWTPGATWSDAFQRVQHFAAPYDDSTRFGSAGNSSAPAVVEAGKVGAACSFDQGVMGSAVGSTACSKLLLSAEGYTLSFWAKFGALDGAQYLVKNSTLNDARQISVVYNLNGDGKLGFYGYPGDHPSSAWLSAAHGYREVSAIEPPTDGAWHHYAWTADGRWTTVYVDGEQVARAYYPYVLGENAEGETEFYTVYGGNGPHFDGTLDEFRLERVVRSAAWVKACYDNQSGRMVSIAPTVREGLMILFR